MKKVTFLLVLLLLALSALAGHAQDAYVPTADEELFGTWINKNVVPQKTVNSPGRFTN